jgi:hydrogenase maturation protease
MNDHAFHMTRKPMAVYRAKHGRPQCVKAVTVSTSSRVLVVTLGNRWAGDDALGSRVADRLRRMRMPGVDLIEAGRRPDRLLDDLGAYRAVFIVDAVLAPRTPPGRLVEFDWRLPRRPPLAEDRSASTHALSTAAVLDLADRLGRLPAVVRIVGVTIRQTRLGTRPLRIACRGIPRVVRRICDLAYAYCPKTRVMP